MSASTAKGIGLWTCISLVGANMIGTGVFTSLGFQLNAVESAAAILSLWLLGGLFALCGALAYAELAAALPRSGGEYHFLGRIYHPALGLMAGLVSMVAGFAAPVALASLAFGEYMGAFFPTVPPTWLALGLVILTTAAHLVDLRTSSIFQNAFSLLKLILIFGFIIAGFSLGREQPHWLTTARTGTEMLSAPFAVSLMFALYAYSGWNAATYILGEIRDPGRTVGRALVTGTLLVAALYILLNAAFLLAAPVDLLRGQLDVGKVVAQQLFGEAGGKLSAALIGLGLISCVSAMTWAGPRVSQVMGEDYRLLAWLGKKASSGVPRRSILLQFALVVIIILTSTFESVLIFTQFALVSCSLLTVLGLLVLRWKEPSLPRPFRCWGYPVSPLLFIAICLFALGYTLVQKPLEAWISMVVMALALSAYPLLSWLDKRRSPQAGE